MEATAVDSVKTARVQDVTVDCHSAKSKTARTWISTGMFGQVCKQIAAEDNWAKNDWVTKVDADAVSFL